MTSPRRRTRTSPSEQTETTPARRQRKVLLAGASGTIGTEVAKELKRRGHWVRALTREAADVTAEVDEIFVGDLTEASTLEGVCRGVDTVFSCAGAPPRQLGRGRGKFSFRQIDDVGNRTLLNIGIEAKVRRYGYLSAYAGRVVGLNDYVRAHESFAAALRTSGLNWLLVRTTPVFAAHEPLLREAREGTASIIGDGLSETNPVHQTDLAAACVEALESNDKEVDVGGPEVLTHLQIAQMALAAWGSGGEVKFRAPWRIYLGQRMMKFRKRHNRAMVEYEAATALVDVVAPSYGTRKLEDYFAECVRRWRAEEERS